MNGVGWYLTRLGDCEALRQVAVLEGCTPGDTFTFGDVGKSVTLNPSHYDPVAGMRVPVPAHTRRAKQLLGFEAQQTGSAVLMTNLPTTMADQEPLFVETRMFTTESPAAVAGKLRGIAAEIDPLSQFTSFAPEADSYGSLRTALNIGSTLLLIMMGGALLLDVVARLHERRRVLSVLSAVGARKSTVVWSVLLQLVAPVGAGLVLAVGAGVGIGALLMRMSEVPVRFGSTEMVGPVAAAIGLMLATMVAALPAIRRVTRTEELRYE